MFMCVRTRLVTIGQMGQITFLAYSFIKSLSQKIIFNPHQYIEKTLHLLLFFKEKPTITFYIQYNTIQIILLA